VAGQEQRERPPTSTLLTNWCWARRMNTRIRVSLAICRTALWVCGVSSCLNTSSWTASMLAVVRAVLDLPLPDFLVINSVCFKRLIKSFNVLFFHYSAGVSEWVEFNAPLDTIQVISEADIQQEIHIVPITYCTEANLPNHKSNIKPNQANHTVAFLATRAVHWHHRQQ